MPRLDFKRQEDYATGQLLAAAADVRSAGDYLVESDYQRLWERCQAAIESLRKVQEFCKGEG